ncbi:MAG TPA: hypothetical protein VM099_04655 [Gemmatimonadaceae bacterium]|nr:hypothetical protein [Gemmatimonadaceae bacterium]
MPLEEVNEAAASSLERLYRQHIYSAHLFAERAQALELRKPEEVTTEDRWRHSAYVTGTLFAAAAFLEASINELYVELKNLGQSGSPRLPARELSLLSQVWPDVQGSAILHKYQVALSLADADSYDESKPPFVDADSLLRLRDALLSPTSDWKDKRGKPQTLEKRLRTKFPANLLAESTAPWFPDRALGAGCAKWAVKIAQTFSDDFCHRMGIPARARVGREKV